MALNIHDAGVAASIDHLSALVGQRMDATITELRTLNATLKRIADALNPEVTSIKVEHDFPTTHEKDE